MSATFEATYSAEDNKLRLYASERLDTELYEKVQETGFRWASKQELFVAPAWTPEREDLCLELAGDITAEQSTLVERAEAKAERLDNLATKRAGQANAFHQAARRIAERFEYGQPILVGHHSERRARKDQRIMHRHMDQSVQAARAVTYWGHRAEGVERHANYKSKPGVRARRIKTLLKDLRDWQRRINHAHHCARLWRDVTQIECDKTLKSATERLSGSMLEGGSCCPMGTWSDLVDGKADHRTVANELAGRWAASTTNERVFRWIDHLLNRLAFERAELGEVAPFDGTLSAVVLQGFAREHGAHKPKACQSKTGDWQLVSAVPLPAHISDGTHLTLSDAAWRELMQSVGYSVPIKRPSARSTKTQVPIVNPSTEEAEQLQALWNTANRNRHNETVRESIRDQSVMHMTQAQYSNLSGTTYSPYQMIELDETGKRIRSHYRQESKPTPVCRVRMCVTAGSVNSASALIVLEDKPSKPLPIQWAVTEKASA